jgi:hypothetical protein
MYSKEGAMSDNTPVDMTYEQFEAMIDGYERGYASPGVLCLAV